MMDFPSSAKKNDHPAKAIVVGVSAGAVEALHVILPALPKGFPFPILIVVHLPPDRKSVMVDLFQRNCPLTVQEAEDKIELKTATVYFAPPDYHLLVEKDWRISLSSDVPVQYSRPSIDVLFESAADALGSDLVGIILTGANSDGAVGLRAVQAAGGIALVQSPKEAQAWAMPEAAIAACPEAKVLTLSEIVKYLINLGEGV